MTLIDSVLEGGDPSVAAIQSNATSFLFARNVRVDGYASAIEDAAGSMTVYGDLFDGYRYVKEYVSHNPVSESGNSAPSSLALPVRETPEFDLGTPDTWTIVEPSGGDDTAAIQDALDSGAEVVALKTGNYLVSSTLVVGESVKAVLGNWSRISMADSLRYSPNPVFHFQNSLHEAVLIEKFDTPYGDHDCHFVQNDFAGTALVFRDSYIVMGIAYRNGGTGPVFIENVHSLSGNHNQELLEPAFRFVGQEAYARQINPEDYIPQIEVVGGSLWVLGFKTGESHGIPFKASEGAMLEVLGGVVNRTGSHFVPEDMPMLHDQDSSMSVTLVERASSPDNPSLPVGEQRFRHTLVVDSLNDSIQTQFMWTDFPMRGGVTYGITIPLYIGYEREALPLWYQAYGLESGDGYDVLYVPWLGYFADYTDSDWVYHYPFGYLYATASSIDSMYLYHYDLGWMYTSYSLFPFAYNYDGGTWVYLLNSFTEPSYYNYATGQWIPIGQL